MEQEVSRVAYEHALRQNDDFRKQIRLLNRARVDDKASSEIAFEKEEDVISELQAEIVSLQENLYVSEESKSWLQSDVGELNERVSEQAAELMILRAYLQQEHGRPNYAEIDGEPGPCEFAVDLLNQPEDLPTALLRLRDKIRDEVIPSYEELGINGRFALSWIRPTVAAADKALKEHDAAAMVLALSDLRSIKA